MLNPSQQALKAVSLALLLCFGPLAQAADAVTQAMQTANGPYRMVLFKTNGTSQSESQQNRAALGNRLVWGGATCTGL